MSARGVFIAGTDTGVGKTRCSVALIHALRATGARVLGFKPVASGCLPSPQGLRNEDALALQAAGTDPAAYASINPYALRDPVAPHLAAAAMGVQIDIGHIAQSYAELGRAADWVVVEAAGGWRVPLSDSLMQDAIPRRLELPVVLIVGLRLGCINHALLSATAIAADGCPLLGWIGNLVDPHMAQLGANIETLRRLLPVPLLGIVPHGRDIETDAQAIAAAAALCIAPRDLRNA
ncbi:MAG: dethiobiotin synthase [Tahibacter sp.]